MVNRSLNVDVRRDVIDFLSRFVDTPEELADDEPLISSGMFDSMVSVQLIDLLQRLYAIEVLDEDLDLANFDSIGGIQRFVRRKLVDG